MTFAAISTVAVGAASIVSSSIARRNARKDAKEQTKTLNLQKAAELQANKEQAQKTVNAARDIVKEGDPTLAQKQRVIDQSSANTIGRAVSTSGSTQEIIKAANQVQTAKNSADNTALTQSAQFKSNAKRFLAERFTAAGQLQLQGQSLINQEAQAALAAISANAQGKVDNVQNTFSAIGNLIPSLQDAGVFKGG